MSSEIKFGMKDLSSYANLDCSEGEERIHEVLANEVTMDGKALVTDVRVPGRVLGHQEVYKELGAVPYIVRLVEDGYLLEFDELPPTSFTRNNKSALERESWSWMTKPSLPAGLTRRRSVGAAAPTASCWLSMQPGQMLRCSRSSEIREFLTLRIPRPWFIF